MTGYSNLNNVKITQVELNDKATILSFTAHGNPGGPMEIPKETYIQPLDKEKLYVKSTHGIPFNEPFAMPASGEVSYKVIFQKIEDSVKMIDLNIGDSNFIYDIQLRTQAYKPALAKELIANWFNGKTGDWELSFTNKSVIYKSKIWSYDKINISKGKGSIRIKNGQQTIDLFVKSNRDGSCLIGLSYKLFILYQKNYTKLAKKIQDTDKPFELPVFKNDSVTYSGYIKDYNSRFIITRLNISVNDILTGEQNSFVAKVSALGYFSVKFPLYYPHSVYIRSSIFNFSVFLEPGKEVFQLIEPKSNHLFMGDIAKINTDLFQLEGLSNFDNDEVKSKILTMSSVDYKTYCQSSLKRALITLDSIYKTKTISAKAYQVEKMELEYNFMTYVMDYKYNYESAYREKNNIQQQQDSNFKVDSLSKDYYNFITNEKNNNPLAVLSSGYNSYINRLKNLDNKNTISFRVDILDVVSELQKRKYQFTNSEKLMVKHFNELKLLNESAEQKEFQDRYGKQLNEFNIKYQYKLMALYNDAKAPVTCSIIEDFLISKGVSFSEREKETIKIKKEFEKSDISVKLQALYLKIKSDSIGLFNTKHQDVCSEITKQKEIYAQIANIQKLGIEVGLATDIILSQIVCQDINVKMTPLSDNCLKMIQDKIKTPFIADYLVILNQQTKNQITTNKNLPGFSVNELPKTTADSVLISILKKYKGKVVYVDFWATWCSPCLYGIRQIKPLKDEMANENVVFVYITNQTSPEETWSNMITGIKGEHFRISKDEWNDLKSKYNISGIPRTMLIDKNGVIRNEKFEAVNNEKIKMELDKLLVE